MYTSNDVLEMMDTLPVGERLFVVEETLRKIRTADPSINNLEPSADQEEPSLAEEKSTAYKHPFLRLAGTWSDAEAEEFKNILAEGDKIDYDEW